MSVSTFTAANQVVVQRATLSTDGFNTRTYATNIASIGMKTDELSGEESKRYERDGQRLTHSGYFAGYPDVLNNDRIVETIVLDNGTSVTRTFEVQGVIRQGNRINQNVYTKVFLIEETRS